MSITFEVAHMREQGQNIIAVVVSPSLEQQSILQQNKICNQIQRCATAAGLAGTVVLVWDSGGDSLGFLAPPQWHSFFSDLTLFDIALNVNRSLTCF